MTEVTNAAPGRETLLVFRLAGEAFALPVLCVHEIIDPIPVTRAPHAPDWAPGLVNVRGAVIPLIDLRRRLRMPPAEAGAEARMIVVEIEVAGAAARLALGADAVEEVLEADTATLRPLPELGARWPEAFLRGVAPRGEGVVVLLDPEPLFRPDAAKAA